MDQENQTRAIKDYGMVLFQYLAGLAVIQIPELDMSVAHGYKVGAVLRERHACHLTGHLVGCYHNVFLRESKSTIH